jgi:integrin-linked kinase
MNVNIVNDHGNTPLHYACFYRLIEIAIYLVDHGALIGAMNKNKKIPLNFAGKQLELILTSRAQDLGLPLDQLQLKTRELDLVQAEARAKHLAQTRQAGLEVNASVVRVNDLLWKTDKYDVYYGQCNHVFSFIKKLSVQLKPTGAQVSRLKEEISKMQKLFHANLMPLLSICLDPGFLSVFYENSQSVSLHMLLHDPEVSFDVNQTLKIAEDVCSALIYLHSNDIGHLNLKSRCIVLNDMKTVQIFDYGLNDTVLAHVGDEPDKIFEPEWIAPEILNSGKIIFQEAADVYSFGILLFELVTREYPYVGMNAMNLGLKVVLEGLRPKLPEFVPKHIKTLIELCWREKHDQRPPLDKVKKVLEQMLVVGV